MSLYGPTNIEDLKSLGRASKPPLANYLDKATNFKEPPTCEIDRESPRNCMGRVMFDESLVQDFLILGLRWSKVGGLKWPEKGFATKKNI